MDTTPNCENSGVVEINENGFLVESLDENVLRQNLQVDDESEEVQGKFAFYS